MTDPQIEADSRTWRIVKGRCEVRIQSSIGTLKARGLDQETADFERGRLAFAEELLKLEEQQDPDYPEMAGE